MPPTWPICGISEHLVPRCRVPGDARARSAHRWWSGSTILRRYRRTVGLSHDRPGQALRGARWRPLISKIRAAGTRTGAQAQPTDAQMNALDTTRTRYLDGFRVDVTIRPGVPRLLPMTRLVRTLVGGLMAGGAPVPGAIGLTLADDAELATLNEAHMGHSGPTDVLSFPLLSPSAFPVHRGQDPAVRVAPGPRSRCRRVPASISVTSWSPWSGPSSRRSRVGAARPATSAGHRPTSCDCSSPTAPCTCAAGTTRCRPRRLPCAPSKQRLLSGIPGPR